MNTSRKPNRSTRVASDYVRASTQLPKAPIDQNYGVGGLACIFEKIPGSRADSNGVINSRTHRGRSYVMGKSSNHNTDEFKVFVACLNEDGRLDSSFHGDGVFDFNQVPRAAYKELSGIVEDAAGNLLIVALVEGDSASHLWKLTASGEPDLTFSNGKGFVDTRDVIKEELVLENVAMAKDRIFASGLRRGPQMFEPVVIALDLEGALWKGFAADGVLDVVKLIPDTQNHIIDGIASFTPPSGPERLVLPLYLMRNGDAYSVTTALTIDGKIDDAFGENGQHWSDPWVINNGFSVDAISQRVSFYGELYSLDEDISLPTVYRITYTGKPAKEFNDGNVLVFDRPGGWHAGVEVADGLVGCGIFYTHPLAFRYTSDGKFDTTFVPPHGYGTFGAQLPADGFYVSPGSIALDTPNQRLLISGRDEEAQGATVPSVIAVSLRTT
ncbi:hypothetical protein [Pseudomonas putida]|uniref:hypothetical protein n=1 Tax=Pseudomonas putida TaxID=303 RepID=UPI001E35514D|nr:hypothetical protein [Pseudomonas putida]